MNILLICDHFPPYSVGGAEISAFNLGEGLSNIGHNVSVLTRYPKKLSVEFENFHAIYSVTYKAIPFKYYFCNSALSSTRFSKKLLYLLKTEDFDIVHAQNWISAYAVMRAKQKMKKFPPSVLTIRDYSYVCPLNDA
ncbi:MAG: glycosyltransferase family 4 protein, partial [Methanosarcinales archaeon]